MGNTVKFYNSNGMSILSRLFCKKAVLVVGKPRSHGDIFTMAFRVLIGLGLGHRPGPLLKGCKSSPRARKLCRSTLNLRGRFPPAGFAKPCALTEGNRAFLRRLPVPSYGGKPCPLTEASRAPSRGKPCPLPEASRCIFKHTGHINPAFSPRPAVPSSGGKPLYLHSHSELT